MCKIYAQLDSVDRTLGFLPDWYGICENSCPEIFSLFIRHAINRSLLNRSGIISCSYLETVPFKAIDCCWIVLFQIPLTALPHQYRVSHVA